MVSREYGNIVYRGYIVMKRWGDPSVITSMMITILIVKIQNIIVIPMIPRIFCHNRAHEFSLFLQLLP